MLNYILFNRKRKLHIKELLYIIMWMDAWLYHRRKQMEKTYKQINKKRECPKKGGKNTTFSCVPTHIQSRDKYTYLHMCLVCNVTDGEKREHNTGNIQK